MLGKKKPALRNTPAQDAANVDTFARRHADPVIRKAADARMDAASRAMSSASLLHPIQFARVKKERDAAIMHSKEFGSGAKYHEPTPI